MSVVSGGVVSGGVTSGDVSSGGVVSSDVISTVTVSSAFMPLVVFAVIFAVPFVLAVTRPVSSMVITSGWSVSHVMVLSVVFSVFFVFKKHKSYQPPFQMGV